LLKIGSTQVSHAALDSSDEASENAIEWSGLLLEGLDSLRSHLAGGIGFLVTITGGTTGLHSREATHTAVLFVELAADLNHLARGLGASG
jgi:hypothetical protein